MDRPRGGGADARTDRPLAQWRSTARRAADDPVVWAGVIAAELLLVAGYFLLTPAAVLEPRYALYPLVWINVGLWAVVQVRVPGASRRRRWIAAAIAAGYFVLLGWLSGILGTTTHPWIPRGVVSLGLGSPGWGPRLAIVTPLAYVYLVPYQVIGFLSLAYLLYASLLDAAGALLRGSVGLVSCVSCTFPLLASIAGTGSALGAAADIGVAGTDVMAVATGLAVDLSTLAFVASVGLLLWRPGS